MQRVFLSGLIAILSVSGVAAAQAQDASDEPSLALSDGRPNLEGFWSNASATRLQRPDNIDNLVLTEEEAEEYERTWIWNVVDESQAGAIDVNEAPAAGAAEFGTRGYNSFWLNPGSHLARVKGEIRTSWLIEPEDGQLPMRPEAREAMRAGDYGSFDHPETRPLAERCLVSFSRSAGPVMQNSLYNNNYQIVQAPEHVMILVEMIHDARIIPIFEDEASAVHRPAALQPWFGDSVGWYEDDALVVRTTNFNPRQRAQLSSSGILTERFSRWSEDQILYEFTVEDPEFYSETWRGEMALNRSTEPLYEYACHEGNYSFAGILAGARREEAAGQTVASNAEVEQ